MITVNDKATIAAISELRTQPEAVLSHLKDNRVILERHKKPVAVMLDYDQFSKLETLLDLAEDIVLGSIAHDRARTAKKDDFIDLEKW